MRRPLVARSDSRWPLSLSVALSLSLVAPFIFGLFDGAAPLEHFRDRAIGQTTLQGVDASGYARNYVAMTALLAASIFAFFAVFAWLDRRLQAAIDLGAVAKELRGIRMLSEVAIVLTVMRLLFRDDFLATLGLVIYGFIAVLFALVGAKVLLRRRQEGGALAVLLEDRPFLVALLFLPMPFLLAFQVVFDEPLGFGGVPVAIGFAAYVGAALFLFAGYYTLLRRRGVTDAAGIRSWNERLMASAVPWILLPLSIPVANELQYAFPDASPRAVSIPIQIALALLCPVAFYLHRRRIVAPAPSFLLAYVYFPIFVVTCTLFRVHRHTRTFSELNYFHLGEFTVPTQQLFSFSSIPLIDLRPAHTLSDLFYQSLYTWAHGLQGLDMMIWHSWMPPVVAMGVLYFFLARLASPAFALLATSLTPLLNVVATYYCYALIPPLFLAAALRRPTVPRFCLVWASAVGLTLWRFDFGMVGWLALALILGVELWRRPRRFRVLLRSLGIAAACVLVGLVLLAVVSHRPALETLAFLVKTYTFRLATRTRVDIIREYSSVAVLQYYVVPAISLIYILYFAIRKLVRGRYISPGQVMAVYVAIFSLAISLRSLERHSLIEGFNPYLSLFLLALLPLFLAGPWKTRTGAAPRAAFYGLLVVAAAFDLPPSSYSRSQLHHLFKPGELFRFHDWDEGSQRVFYDGAQHEDLVRFLDRHLKGDQTFYDFTNSPLLYVFADKKFPTYVIPNLIQTSESVQSDVLADLSALHAEQLLPFVVFKQGNRYWDNVDKVPNEVRSYRIAEFIYRHYRPFALIGRYHVWLENSLDPEPLWKDLEAPDGSAPGEALGRRIREADLVQDFSLGELPHVWARYDPWNSREETEVQAALLDRAATLDEDAELALPLAPAIDKTDGNYLHLTIRDDFLGPEISNRSVPRLFVEYGHPVSGSFDLRTFFDPKEQRRTPLPLARDPVLHHVESSVVGGRRILRSVGGDPYVHRAFDFEDLDPIDPGDASFVVVDYRSLKKGQLQIFFSFNGRKFERANSSTFRVRSTIGTREPARLAMRLPLDSEGVAAVGSVRLTDLRFDLPRDSLFELVRVELVRQGSSSQDYLVRLSTQWSWMSQEVREIRLRATAPVTLEQVLLRRGD